MYRRREAQHVDRIFERHAIKAIAALAIFVENGTHCFKRVHLVSDMWVLILAVIETHAANFPFDKRCQLPNQNLFTVFGTPDKMVSQLVGDMFGVLRIHTRHYDKCSSL